MKKNLRKVKLKLQNPLQLGFSDQSNSKPNTPVSLTFSSSAASASPSPCSNGNFSPGFRTDPFTVAHFGYANEDFGSPSPSVDSPLNSPSLPTPSSDDRNQCGTYFHPVSKTESVRSHKGLIRSASDPYSVDDFAATMFPNDKLHTSTVPQSTTSNRPTLRPSTSMSSSSSFPQYNPDSSFMTSILPLSSDLALRKSEVLDLYSLYERISFLFSHIFHCLNCAELKHLPFYVNSVQRELFSLFHSTGIFYLLLQNTSRGSETGNSFFVFFERLFPHLSRLALLSDLKNGNFTIGVLIPMLGSCTEKLFYILQSFMITCANSSFFLQHYTNSIAFVEGTPSAGNWSGNGLTNSTNSTRFLSSAATLSSLDTYLYFLFQNCSESMEKLKSQIVKVDDDLIDDICYSIINQCKEVLNYIEKWDLSAVSEISNENILQSFFIKKQLCYDLTGELACFFQELTLGNVDKQSIVMRITGVALSFQQLFGYMYTMVKGETFASFDKTDFLCKKFQSYFVDDSYEPEVSGLFKNGDNPSEISRSSGYTAISNNSKESFTVWRWSRRLSTLLDDISDEPLIFNNNKLRGGTLSSLVSYLIANVHMDKEFRHVFLLTYKSFVTANELLALLIMKFHSTVPLGISEDKLAIWKKKDLIKKKNICTVINLWVQKYFAEDLNSKRVLVCLSELNAFVRDFVIPSFHIGTVILEEIDNLWKESEIPEPVNQVATLDVFSYSPKDFAVQVTIIEFDCFKSIPTSEWINKRWLDHRSRSAIRDSINFSNCFTFWIINSILDRKNIKARAFVISYFIQVAYECLAVHNFSTLIATVSALNSAPVYRLRAAYKLVSLEDTNKLKGLQEIVESKRNFVAYRTLIKQIELPCVPFLGVFLSDLTFIDEGNPEIIDGFPHLINFSKRQRISSVVDEICYFQSVFYNFVENDRFTNSIRQHCQNVNQDLSDLFDKSLSIEPRCS
ncbi:exchange factor Cdc25p-like protein [Schizosaccharomyces cryophilus OY26]|uniref:Exchange factor Cdc25p-like protein n=1 Tax=Schizosaccharomyces cryophilus (strain OY26 / ATCC MYA-4695 / CBS 11777 / NBRC 106824 / NRRL Y48691) TaxID=653667 RepID=S9XJM5_SCHCR|nr:exchange factor Cdc25p-like protein [Schizosaccharomyces cryophilus OY26]EPY53906.1 exchange factor Cdc25p-like protein [Schizosaccharomyces cryophilus OY26]